MSREMDADIAVKVFGWSWIREDADQPQACPYITSTEPGSCGVFYPHMLKEYPDGDCGTLPRYSTSPADAWGVVEKMRKMGWTACIADRGERFVSFEPAGNKVSLTIAGDCQVWSGHEVIKSASDPTMPLAVCKAALCAVGGR